MLILINLLFLLILKSSSCLIYRDEIVVSLKENENFLDKNIDPYSPIVQCHFLWEINHNFILF